jgi:hypothetical protein
MIIKINPKADAENIRKAIKLNGGYCPCALVKTPDTKCMCKDFLDQEEGLCNCGLYIKEKEE